jgi:hypothetical protein
MQHSSGRSNIVDSAEQKVQKVAYLLRTPTYFLRRKISRILTKISNGKQEEIYQTLRNNKQENLDQVHAVNIIKPMQTLMNHEKYPFCVIKLLEHLKNFKNWPRPHYMPRTDHACPQTPNPSR